MSVFSICIRLRRRYSALKLHPLPHCHRVQAHDHIIPQWFWRNVKFSAGNLRFRRDLKTYSHPCNFILGKLRPRQEKWLPQGSHFWAVSEPRPCPPFPDSQARVLFIRFLIRIEHLFLSPLLPWTPTPLPFPSLSPLDDLPWNTYFWVMPRKHWTQTLVQCHWQLLSQKPLAPSMLFIVPPCLSWFLISLSIRASQSWLSMITCWWAVKKCQCLVSSPRDCDSVVWGGPQHWHISVSSWWV